MLIDLRSDTVTKPSSEMLEAMMQAEVGDDVFGDDPEINRLQQDTANYFGMEAGLFFPSGTMANQVAIKTHTQPGDEVICDSTAHVYRYEGGGIATNSGASVRLLQGVRGIFSADEILQNINSEDVHFPRSSLLVVENTVNKGGGICWNEDQLSSVTETGKSHGLAVHLDGARLWNALVYSGQNALKYGQWFNSISVCFSKGMGCPVGSVLLGTKEFIHQAKRHRKRFGGGMRQAGFLAAAANYALQNNISRLTLDHQKAKHLESVLKDLNWVEEIMPVETNIVLFKTNSLYKALELVASLKQQHVLATSTGGGWIRFVTHLDISEDNIANLTEILKKTTV